MVVAHGQFEQKIADYLSERIPALRVSRYLRGEAVDDVRVAGTYSCEVKTRKSFPQYLLDWIEQARRNSRNLVPFLVWHKNYMRLGEQLVIISLEDFRDIIAELHELREGEKCHTPLDSAKVGAQD